MQRPPRGAHGLAFQQRSYACTLYRAHARYFFWVMLWVRCGAMTRHEVVGGHCWRTRPAGSVGAAAHKAKAKICRWITTCFGVGFYPVQLEWLWVDWGCYLLCDHHFDVMYPCLT